MGNTGLKTTVLASCDFPLFPALVSEGIIFFPRWCVPREAEVPEASLTQAPRVCSSASRARRGQGQPGQPQLPERARAGRAPPAHARCASPWRCAEEGEPRPQGEGSGQGEAAGAGIGAPAAAAMLLCAALRAAAARSVRAPSPRRPGVGEAGGESGEAAAGRGERGAWGSVGAWDLSLWCTDAQSRLFCKDGLISSVVLAADHAVPPAV